MFVNTFWINNLTFEVNKMITLTTADVAYNTTLKSIKDTNLYRDIQFKVYSIIDKSIKDNKFCTYIDDDMTMPFDTIYPIMIVLQEELSGLGYKTELKGITDKKLKLYINWNKSKF